MTAFELSYLPAEFSHGYEAWIDEYKILYAIRCSSLHVLLYLRTASGMNTTTVNNGTVVDVRLRKDY